MTPEDRLQHLVTLTAGLLASGHYTGTDPRSLDAFPKRHIGEYGASGYCAAEDAQRILKQLEEDAKHEG